MMIHVNKHAKSTSVSRQNMRAKKLKQLISELGAETVSALHELYSVYDEGLYIWLSCLYDRNIGGFYYSNSARENEGYLPDVESTAQALSLAKSSGLFSAYGKTAVEALPEWMRCSVLSFVKGLQDPEDGYFYHPQWGKSIVDSRRGRDYIWATSLISDLGGKPDYATAAQRLKEKKNCATFPEHFRSIDSFRKYLYSFEERKVSSYRFGNTVASQSREIRAAGDEYMNLLIDFLNERQNPDNGLWESEVNFASVNGIMPMSKLYNAFGKPLPNAEVALESALRVAGDGEVPTFVCQFYNPWLTMARIMENVKAHGDSELHERLRKKIRKAAPAAISVTAERISRFKKTDGSFSYFPDKTSEISQCAPVAVPGTNEGDVNASVISSVGTTSTVCDALGIEILPIFSTEDSKVFFSMLESSMND